MSTTVVNTHEAKSRLSELLRLVEAGEDVVIARAGKEIARIVPIRSLSSARVPGALRGQIVVHGEFNAADADVADLFEGADERAPW